jgi:hypothetical protein
MEERTEPDLRIKPVHHLSLILRDVFVVFRARGESLGSSVRQGGNGYQVRMVAERRRKRLANAALARPLGVAVQTEYTFD